MERDLYFYDREWLARIDLVVTAVHDHDQAVEELRNLQIWANELRYSAGQVVRVRRPLRGDDLSDRLEHLPCIFDDVALFYQLEFLERAETSVAMDLVILPRQGEDLPLIFDVD